MTELLGVRFEILGHAAMRVEANGTSILIDPWLVGSCYWRSWWNYPPVPPLGQSVRNPDYVYITHHHWDHYHGPTLRKLDRSAHILFPKATSPRLVDDLRPFRFDAVTELPHGKTVTLNDTVDVTTYHFGLSLDSAIVIDDGETVLLNLNDCKITGRPLRQLLRRHPRIDFMLRSHSNASVYPFCVDAEDERELAYRQNQDYVDDFVRAAKAIRPRYAVPFASNHCFLHAETKRYNETTVSPKDVKAHVDAVGLVDTECVMMAAGDSWDSTSGFAQRATTYFEDKDRHLTEYEAAVSDKLDEQYAKERRATVRFDHFHDYFDRLVRSLPKVIRSRIKGPVVFRIKDRDLPLWVVDFRQRRVYETPDEPPDTSLVLTLSALVLRDCVRRNMFSVLMPSKRLRVDVRKGHVMDLFVLIQVLDMHEYDMFPLRRNLRPRPLGAWLRRWREVAYYASVAARVFAPGRGNDPTAAVPRIR